MKCRSCHQEWVAAEGVSVCPFCGESVRLSDSEIDRLIADADQALSTRNDTLAAQLYGEAAEQGHARAEYRYATLLEEGRGIKKSHAKAMVYYKSAARQGHHKASYRLSVALKQMNLPEELSLFWARVAAAQGDPNGAYELGKVYEKGQQLPGSVPRALYWYARSAGAGNEEASIELVRYYTEDGTELSKAHARYFLPGIKSHRFMASHFQRKLGKGEALPPMVDKLLLSDELCDLGEQAEEKSEQVVALSMYSLAGELGNLRAQCRLGLCYEKGLGTDKDMAAAAERYRIAAEGGYAPAMTRLGILLRDSREGALAPVAIKWLTEASEAGEVEADYALGCAYYEGKGVKQDLLLARRYFAQAAQMGHEEAAARSAELEEALEELCSRAAEAQQEKRYQEAFNLYRVAAQMGHRGARCHVGSCYQTGLGVERNAKEAVRYYTLAAEDGSMAAVYNLGLCYFRGEGVPCNYRSARLLLEKAAKGGYADAEAVLAEMERRKQQKTAQKLYSIATMLYRRGDVDGAIKARMLAAGMGSGKAMFVLGCHYEFGEGLPYDHEAADRWYRKATDLGFQNGAGRLKAGFVKESKRRASHRRT